MSTATPSDVDGVIDTSLSDSEVQSFLDDAEFEAEQAIDDYQNALTNTEQTQLEKYLAALLIRQNKEKAVTSESRETASLSYEDIMTVNSLRTAVQKRDPSGTLAQVAINNRDRYIGSTVE
jgi:hypothetical protein